MCHVLAMCSGRGTDKAEERRTREGIEANFRPSRQNRLAPLICRVVRAMRAVRVLGAGLGFPVGVSAPLRFSPPNLPLSFLDDVDDNNGRGEMTHFLILSMARTTARLLDHYDEGRP